MYFKLILNSSSTGHTHPQNKTLRVRSVYLFNKKYTFSNEVLSKNKKDIFHGCLENNNYMKQGKRKRTKESGNREQSFE